MKTVEEVRRERLSQLIDQFGGLANLNELLGYTRTDSTLSQYKNKSENSKGGSPKAMGSTVARRLEQACKKDTGWMDTDPAFDEVQWPFGERLTPKELNALPPDLLSEAVGSLRALVREAQRRSGPSDAGVEVESQALSRKAS